MRAFRCALAALALTLYGVISPAGAMAHGSSLCGGTWAEQAECSFGFAGTPLVVEGTASGPGDEEVSVHVEIMAETPAGRVPLYSCAAAGNGSTSCRDSLGEVGVPLDVAEYSELICAVHGHGAAEGTYMCSSGPE